MKPLKNYQTIDAIMEAATPEQLIIWNYLFLKFGDNIAVQQYYWKGTGGDPMTYALGKMFFAYEFYASALSGVQASQGIVTFVDEGNVTEFIASDLAPWWNSTAVNNFLKHIYLKNLAFASFSAAQYTTFMFWGYRIIYQ